MLLQKQKGSHISSTCTFQINSNHLQGSVQQLIVLLIPTHSVCTCFKTSATSIIDCSITSHLSLNYRPENYYWSSLRVEKSFTIKMSPHNFCGTCCNAFPSCHAWPTDMPGPRWRTYTTTWSLKGYGCFTAKTKWRKGENYLTAILQPKSFFANGHLCLNF